MESPAGSTPTGGPAPNTDASSMQVDVDSILAEVEALAAKATEAALVPDAGTPSMTKEEQDLAALEREIEALLSGKPVEPAQVQAAAPVAMEAPAPQPTRSVAAEALEEQSVDPLIQEIDAVLNDDADALLKQSDGDMDRALATVFDARALGGQEEEINRALIEAFGTSKSQRPSFATPPVTNPVPAFEGVSREMPASNPNATTASQAKPRINLEYAGEKPFEPAFPKIDAIAQGAAEPGANASTSAAPNATPKVAPIPAPPPTVVPTAAPAATAATAPPSPVQAVEHASVSPDAAEPVAAIPTGPGLFTRLMQRAARFATFLATLPLQLCSLPMRVMPDSARTVVGIAAITLVFWTPLAWWYATTQAKAPGVGRVNLVEREASATAEGEATEAAESKDSAASGSASHGSSGH